MPWEPDTSEPHEGGLRELPEQDKILRIRDRFPIEYVPAETFHCKYCPQPGGDGAGTTVEWMGVGVDGPDGRCRECGQKYILADPSDRHAAKWLKEREPLQFQQRNSPE